MKIAKLDPFPPKSNPFNHDLYHQGTNIGTNVAIMYANNSKERCDYLVIVDKETGERYQISFEQGPIKEFKKRLEHKKRIAELVDTVKRGD